MASRSLRTDSKYLVNPTVLIEVLSPSTEAYDRGGKFSHYRKITTLREYLMVTQGQPSLECYLRLELCS